MNSNTIAKQAFVGPLAYKNLLPAFQRSIPESVFNELVEHTAAMTLANYMFFMKGYAEAVKSCNPSPKSEDIIDQLQNIMLIARHMELCGDLLTEFAKAEAASNPVIIKPSLESIQDEGFGAN